MNGDLQSSQAASMLFRIRPTALSRHLVAIVIFAAFHVVINSAICHGAEKRALTVTDSLNTARLLPGSPTMVQPITGGTVKIGQQDVFVSPDGTRYAVLLVRGNVPRNGNWLEIISGRLDSFEAATHPVIMGRLFMSSLGSQFGYETTMLTFTPTTSHIAWLDNNRLAFLWGDANNISQIFVADLSRRTVNSITHHPTNVVNYGMSRAAHYCTWPMWHIVATNPRS